MNNFIKSTIFDAGRVLGIGMIIAYPVHRLIGTEDLFLTFINIAVTIGIIELLLRTISMIYEE